MALIQAILLAMIRFSRKFPYHVSGTNEKVAQ
jgi:hypothetical protein